MKKKPITALIYDLDGTLIDSRRDLCIATNVMLTHFSLSPKSEEELQNYIGRGVKHLVSRALDGNQARYGEGFEILRSYYAGHLTEHTTLYDGVVEVLEHFRPKQQFVLSNKLDEETNLIVQQLNIARYFTEAVGEIEGVPIKPDPANLLAILDKHGLMRQDAVMVGDSAIDIETGSRAGVTTVFIEGGLGKRGAIEPDLVIDRIADLMDYFI